MEDYTYRGGWYGLVHPWGKRPKPRCRTRRFLSQSKNIRDKVNDWISVYHGKQRIKELEKENKELKKAITKMGTIMWGVDWE